MLTILATPSMETVATVGIVCAIITTLSAIACGVLCVWYKHIKKNNKKKQRKTH